MEYWDLYDSERKPLNRVHKRGEAFRKESITFAAKYG